MLLFCVFTLFYLDFHYNSELYHSPLFSTVPQSVYIEDLLINSILSLSCCSRPTRSINFFEFDHDSALLIQFVKVSLKKNLLIVHLTISIINIVNVKSIHFHLLVIILILFRIDFHFSILKIYL
jgi:hypothetical protein